MIEAGTIGWIGLGKLGLPMAARLAASGRAVNGYDRDPARMALALERGVASAQTVDELSRGCEVMFTSLPDDHALIAVILGNGGVLAALKRGAILVETSTVSPDASAEVAQACELRGIAYLRLPISGSSALAEA